MVDTSPRAGDDGLHSGADQTTAVLVDASGSPATGGVPQRPTGTLIARYVVLEEVGRGAMGRVLRAYDPRLQREVALKELRTTAPEGMHRLVAEARAMAKLVHPNVVAVHDVEEVPAGDGGERASVVLVMEFVAGATLQAWLAARPPWREIVARFVDAGRGLAAAHAVGVLHRDFKPANVLVGGRGAPLGQRSDATPLHAMEVTSVKVTDFGLAKLDVLGPDSEPLPSASHAGSEIFDEHAGAPTQTGIVLGSPRYMAPEQHRGDPLGPGADQYAFCVALWEALAGTPPFVGNTLVAIARAKHAGPPAFPRATIPRHLAAALRRGLAVDPDARWPSMNALLAALSRDPSRVRRRVALGVTTVAAALVVAAQPWAAAPPPRCTDGPERMAGVWDDDVRAAVRTTMLGVGAAYGSGAWTHAEATLDGYARDWLDMHTEACEATEIRHEQPASVMHLRMACLHRARIELGAVTRALAQADRAGVQASHRTVGGLRPLSRCADVDVLEHDIPPPPEHEAAAVERARVHLAQSEAAEAAGRHAAALAEVDAATREVEGLSYAPIRTEIAVERGDVLGSLGELDQAEASLRSVLELGTRHQQWDEVFRASMLLMYLVGEQRERPDEALRYREIATALAGDDPRKRAQLASNLALVFIVQGKYAEAEAEARRSVALREALLGPDHLDVAISRNRLGGTLFEQGRIAEAEVEYRAVLALRTATLGPEHPTVASARGNVAQVLSAQGKDAEAEAEERVVLSILRGAFGPDHPQVGSSHANLANMLDAQGRHSEALDEYRRALAIQERALGPEHPSVAHTLHNMASTLDLLDDRTAAEAAQRRALAIRIGRLGADHRYTGESHRELGVMMQRHGRAAEAEAQYRRAIEVLESSLAPDHPDVASSHADLGALLLEQGRLDDAEPELRRAVAAWDRVDDAGERGAASAWADLAALLLLRGEPTLALPLAERAWGAHRRREVEAPRRAATAFVLARALRAGGEPPDATERARELAEQARSEYERLGDAAEVERIDRWLRG